MPYVVYSILALALALGAFLLYVAVKLPTYVISRDRTFQATPEEIFLYLNNSQLANSWMPWAEMDPKVQMTYSGPDEGVGSISSWTSSGPMGVGQAEVVESVPNQHVKTKLTYTKPMAMEQLATISLHPEPNGTIVLWEVTGETPFVGRIFCIMINMNKLVGRQFEKGLDNLAKLVDSH